MAELREDVMHEPHALGQLEAARKRELVNTVFGLFSVAILVMAGVITFVYFAPV